MHPLVRVQGLTIGVNQFRLLTGLQHLSGTTIANFC